MPADLPSLDATDRALLVALQRDARRPVAELARAINLSASATAERLRRLQESGVVTGTRAVVDPVRAGYPIMAFVRLNYPLSNYGPFHEVLDTTPELLEAHHVTGDDCFIIKAVARDMADLERLVGRLSALGRVTTNVVYSSPLAWRDVRPA